MDQNPLEYRVFKHKKSTLSFYCPLCRTERALTSTYKLSAKNYLQILMTSVFFVLILFPLMELKSLWIFFVVWAGFELGVRLVYRKEIPCPHCGFDASWYQKDVKMARKLVTNFWDTKKPKEEVEIEPEIKQKDFEDTPVIPEISPDDASIYLN